jgi:hypothetical protein
MVIRNIFKRVFICTILAFIPIMLFAHDWNAPKEAAERRNPVPKDAAAMKGAKNYLNNSAQPVMAKAARAMDRRLRL